MSAVAWFIASRHSPRRRSGISTRRFRSGPTPPRLISIRGLLYQPQNQHQLAIDDFTTAIGLTQNQAEPFVGRGLSYLAVGDLKAAASDFEAAVQIEPLNLKAWTSRGFAYERLGDKERAAGSYARALNINQSYEPARSGFTRVGGRYGETYQTFD